jgi:hypothetical protein
MDIGQEGGCLQLYGGGGGCPVPRDRYLLADGWMEIQGSPLHRSTPNTTTEIGRAKR